MRAVTRILALAITLTATTALAHYGVKNAKVMARMKAMGSIAQNTKILGNMSKGVTDFDATEARQVAKAIARQAAKMPVLFEVQADDPKSEALPVIWDDFAAFAGKAQLLQSKAADAATAISTRADLRAALGEIGGACQSCHQTYRK